MELEGPCLLHNGFDVKMRKGGGKKKEQEEAAQVESLYLMAAPFSDEPTSAEQFRDAACIHCQCVCVCV